MKTEQTPEEIIEDFLRHEASQFPSGTEEEMLYRFRNHILFIEEEKHESQSAQPKKENT